MALHEGRPFIATNGTIELWHGDCWTMRDTPVVVEAAPIAVAVAMPSSRTARKPRRIAALIVGGFAGSAVLVMMIAQQAAAESAATSLVNVEVVGNEVTSLRAASATRELVPPKPTNTLRLEERFPMPVDRNDVPLAVTYPTLAAWIHPITGVAERFPWSQGRHFGAVRTGVERIECGEGHCGVDLDGPHGRPLVAVAAGIVVRVERRELGGDGRSGRYVRIQHEDGTLTAYMHMDEVEATLETGDHLEAGQYIGTLGATGVKQSVPHVHFSLEVPNRRDLRGDLSYDATRFIDPAPFLIRATIADVPERRHPVKPAF